MVETVRGTKTCQIQMALRRGNSTTCFQLPNREFTTERMCRVDHGSVTQQSSRGVPMPCLESTWTTASSGTNLDGKVEAHVVPYKGGVLEWAVEQEGISSSGRIRGDMSF